MALDNVHRDEETPFYRIARITDKYSFYVLLKYEIFTSNFFVFCFSYEYIIIEIRINQHKIIIIH